MFRMMASAELILPLKTLTLDSLPMTSSAIVDVNQVSQSAVSASLRTLASLSIDAICNAVFGNSLKFDLPTQSFFTSAFPPLFPYDIGKHTDSK